MSAKPSNSGFTQLFRHYKKNAQKRGHAFELTEAQFKKLVTSNCYFCHSPPSQQSVRRDYKSAESRERATFVYTGIDRIDNKVGYVAENCVPACGSCNYAKGKKSFEEFVAWAKQLAISLIYKSNPLPPKPRKKRNGQKD